MKNLEFYAVCHSQPDSLNNGISSVNHKVNLLTSYSSIYKNPRKKIEYPKNRNKLMIDSGAYDLLIREGNEDFPFTPKEYAESIKSMKIKPDYVVSMDYLCNPEDRSNNKKLIIKTIKNAEILKKEFKNENELTFTPVVQGYYTDEYLYCLKEMLKKKIIQNGSYIGIGSLAVRKKIKETQTIIKTVFNHLKSRITDFKIHCFGINMLVIRKREVFNIIDSIDSLAWTYPYRYGRVKLFTGERVIEANTNGYLREPEFYYLSLDATLKYIKFLNLKLSYKSSPHTQFQYKNTKKFRNFKYVQKLAKDLVLNEDKIKEISKVNDFIEFIFKINNRFPREFELLIDKIATYTGEKLLFLEPRNTKIGKKEFIYSLLSSLENVYLDLYDNDGDFSRVNKLIKDFYDNIKNSYSELNLIKECMNSLKLDSYFHTIFPFDINHEIPKNYYKNILMLKENLELKRIDINPNILKILNKKESQIKEKNLVLLI